MWVWAWLCGGWVPACAGTTGKVVGTTDTLPLGYCPCRNAGVASPFVLLRQPVSPSARQPVSPSARQPVSPSARQPVSPSARDASPVMPANAGIQAHARGLCSAAQAKVIQSV
ncbi:hypothetical protein GCM10007935_16520 [Hydrogenophaga electricum]|uniref:Secreted protein n=1 Tax=Hydrogenophaga electricum TaxID=1230953 RepID=A0ABQ6C1X8_9BURK|nr:hypothetical protein GCM10007935_16520 [Hydrogenophaga electricum]